ncbi:Uma2 family endonuclease [Chloroflexus sp.]|uniref:Uma2 family endonuclease n=1 Tax=Chloroflexus sp. TaxID=1904827 RepID=UPI002ACD8B6D|nr:Uma2 family endonuclease [Chloroflexus sp.]
MTSQPVAATPIVYPDSDGMPMADNTKQFRAIVTIQGNLDALFRERADVFVAGDLLWYPIEGRPDIRRAPDVMVVFGRPKGDRGSYRQWEEDNIAPQVVFEVLSPNNTLTEMAATLEFYDIYGVAEYYLYDPDTGDMSGWQRIDNWLRVISELDGWVSPRLGITFGRTADGMQMYWPDGRPFVRFVELQAQAEQERQRAEQERQRAEQERQRAEQERQRAERERQRAEQERQRAERLAERLRALGVYPE